MSRLSRGRDQDESGGQPVADLLLGPSQWTGKVSTLLRTALCDLLDVEHPIIQAGMGPFAPATLAAAVCNAGGLGSLGTFGLDPIKLVRPVDDLDRQFTSIRELTDRPFAINFVVPYFEERAEQLMALFDRALSIQPAVVSFALGDPTWSGGSTTLGDAS